MAPVKLPEINISQRQSDDSKGSRGNVCRSLYSHKPTYAQPEMSIQLTLQGKIDG